MNKITIGNKSMLNPFYIKDNFYKYQGTFHEDMFFEKNHEAFQYLKTQTKNYLKLKNLLSNKNLSFDTIFIGVFPGVISKAISFVIISNINNKNEQIIWRKYGSKSNQGDQNHYYYLNNNNVEKIKTTSLS